MDGWTGYASWIAVMGALLVASGFFSASEAAFFYLSRPDRRRLASGNTAQQVAARLLRDPDRLLSGVLFCNLVANLLYFTLSSSLSLRLERAGRPGEAGAVAVVSLLVLITVGELLPKSLAVIRPAAIAMIVALPLRTLLRTCDPLLPIFRLMNLLSQRLLWPNFQPEPYLQVSDLERAVRLSTADAALLGAEQKVLESLVALSAMRADELMRPRVQFPVFRPPVARLELTIRTPPGGYLLLSEAESDEVAAVVPLRSLSRVPEEHLELLAEPVIYVPWCTTVAQTLESLRRANRRVAAVVNEYGETIGILPLDDILDTIFSPTSSRSERLFQRQPLRQVAPGVWHVTGMTSLRRLLRHFNVPGGPTHSVTVAGIVQEALERLPQRGDECRWGPFLLRVIDVPDRGRLLVELRLAPEPAP